MAFFANFFILPSSEQVSLKLCCKFIYLEPYFFNFYVQYIKQVSIILTIFLDKCATFYLNKVFAFPLTSHRGHTSAVQGPRSLAQSSPGRRSYTFLLGDASTCRTRMSPWHRCPALWTLRTGRLEYKRAWQVVWRHFWDLTIGFRYFEIDQIFYLIEAFHALYTRSLILELK